MKSKEISKLLAVTVTATTILNPYMAYAETANKSQTEISVEANDTNKAENVGESLQQEEINTDTAVNSQVEDSNETTDNVADEVTEEAVNNEEAGTVTDDSAINATTESSEESAPSVSEGSLYLSQLDWIGNKSSVGYGSIVKDGNIEKNKIRLLVDGELLEYDRGLGAHAPSTLVYDLTDYSKTYTKFTAHLGVDYSQRGKGNGVIFTISTSEDGNNWTEVEKTGVITPNMDSQFVNINIEGVKYLKLSASDNGNRSNDHAVYGDARLLTTDYDVSQEDLLVGLLKTSGYDTLLKSKSVEYNIKNNEYLILQRALVNRVGYHNLQNLYKKNDVNKAGIDFLLNNNRALKYFITNGEATIDGSYISSIESFCKIYDKHKAELEDSSDNYFNLRLATSISLAYSRDVLVKFWEKSNQELNPVRRYEIFQDLISSGIIDQGGDTENFGKWSSKQFKALPIPLMKWTVDTRMNDDEIKWLAEYALQRKQPDNSDYLSAYSYIAYTSGYNYANSKYYDEANFKTFDDKYHFSKYYSDYGNKDVYRLWMVFEEGSVCGGLAKTYANLSEVFGRPSSVVGQPGHAATITYGWNTKTNQYEWLLQNNVSGWSKSGNEYTDRMLNWGNASWCTGYSASYVGLATDAVETEEAYDKFVQATMLNLLTDSYDDLNVKEQIYREALKIQNINLDSFEGLVETYKANSNKTSKDYLDLAKMIVDAYTYYPLPMSDLLKYLSDGITDPEDVVVFDLIRTNALNKAKVATRDDVKQPDIAIALANFLLGEGTVELASFSFDGDNAGSIVINSKYDDTDIRVQYSLDGGKSWQQTANHVIKLSQDEISKINSTDDIKVGLVGSSEVFTLDVKDGTNVSTGSLTINDISNTLEGKIDNLQFSNDAGKTWCDYVKDITFDGDQTVQVRYKANGLFLQGEPYTFTFTKNKDTDTRKYIRASHLSLFGFSTENGTSSTFAASGMLDENPLTTWHTRYGYTDPDKFVAIELDSVRYITAVEYEPAAKNGRFKSAQVYTSLDGKDWVLSGTAENLADNTAIKSIDLNAPTAAKYVKIVATETYGNTAGEVNKYASGKGFYLYEDTTKTYGADVDKNQSNDEQSQGNTAEPSNPNTNSSSDKGFYDEFLEALQGLFGKLS